VPEDERPALNEVVARLKLDQMSSERQKIRAISSFFHDNFKYSLNIPISARGNGTNTPLGRFLLQTRSGHCEYFATATVLLLRQAGIRARYITGYAVPESARHGDMYLVRARHSHAWALVYHTDSMTWEQIDNTPGSWAEETEASAPWWQSTSDFASNIFFQFSKWRWGKASISRYAQWALAPLILYLVWRILSTRRRQHDASDGLAGSDEPVWPGLDSELYLIDRRLADLHLARQPHESLSRWQQRVEAAFPTASDLSGIFLRHRRLRFDPRGLPSHEREILRSQAMDWLTNFQDLEAQRKQAGPE
jgi:protein-glutamine gamma-glutamyltransferase